MLTRTDRFLTSREACAAIGVTYRVLDYWARTGALTPEVEADGSGSRRLWSGDDVRVGQVLAVIGRHGAGTEVLAVAGGDLQGLLDRDRFAGAVVVDVEGRVHRPGAAASGWYVDLDVVG